MYLPVLITAPAALPVTLEDVAFQVRLDAADEDPLVRGMINAATEYLDGFTGILGRCLVTQTWRQDFDWFERCLRLPLFPTASVTTVKYLNTAGVLTTVSASDYALQTDELGSYVEFDLAYAFPALVSENGPRVQVTYVAGSAVASVPAAIKQAILVFVAAMFENREGWQTNVAAHNLIAPYRRVGI